jgi:chromosome transmission fidelity protein 8
MLIPITSGGDGMPEWAMVELQGTIEIQGGKTHEGDLAVATLKLASSGKDTVVMTVGYHQLEGKRVPLKKPLAIMEKTEESQPEGGVGYVVVGVIRNKYLFKTRPRAMISKPHTR